MWYWYPLLGLICIGMAVVGIGGLYVFCKIVRESFRYPVIDPRGATIAIMMAFGLIIGSMYSLALAGDSVWTKIS